MIKTVGARNQARVKLTPLPLSVLGGAFRTSSSFLYVPYHTVCMLCFETENNSSSFLWYKRLRLIGSFFLFLRDSIVLLERISFSKILSHYTYFSHANKKSTSRKEGLLVPTNSESESLWRETKSIVLVGNILFCPRNNVPVIPSSRIPSFLLILPELSCSVFFFSAFCFREFLIFFVFSCTNRSLYLSKTQFRIHYRPRHKSSTETFLVCCYRGRTIDWINHSFFSDSSFLNPNT